jgi:hypothetical protein
VVGVGDVNPEGPGLRCVNCRGRLDVVDSRRSGPTIRRRRRCRNCNALTTTFEIAMPPPHRNPVLKFVAALALRDHLTGPTAAGQLSLDAALVGFDAEEAPYG